MKIVSSFGERIKQYREENKYTLAEMERLTGVPAPTINRYELGQRVPKLDLATLIAHKLQLNPFWLFGYDADMQPPRHNDSLSLTDHECKVVAAYREQPSTQPFVDKLLGIEDNSKILLAARGEKIKLDKKSAAALAKSAKEAPNSSQNKDMF